MRPPAHIAIIMDGNGRWARARMHPRQFGHIRGAKVARSIIEECSKTGIKYLTLFAFSTENWQRPNEEVSLLMRLLQKHLLRERATLVKNNIRFQTIGDTKKLPPSIQNEILKTIDETKNNSGLVLTFALNYGGRQDITAASKKVAELVKSGSLDLEDITEQTFSNYLDSASMPDPDLIIRTSGESRISNFMLWQAAYSELYITPILWPEFGVSDFQKALDFYSSRERRFGKTSSDLGREIQI